MSSSSYLPLNPFVDVSVGEDHLWNSSAWTDIPQIHAGPFADVCEAVDETRSYKQTQVRFVRGAGGSGKSHLFVRLLRKYADGILYAYAANPPLNPDAIEPWLLTCLIRSLRHRSRDAEGIRSPYSQIRLLAYVFLKPVIEPRDLPISELHDAWEQMTLPDREKLVADASRLLSQDHPEMNGAIVQCLLSTLISEKESLASDWLAGGAYLTDAQLQILGLNDTLNRVDYAGVIHLLGQLAGLANLPFVLALDQLDQTVTTPQIAEFQKILMGLINQSASWSVLVGVTTDVFAKWESEFNQALRSRIGSPDSAAKYGYRLPVYDVVPLNPAEQRLLLETRLRSPRLAQQRAADGVPSEFHPFVEADLKALTASTSGSVYPRTLLALARDRYKASLTIAPVQPQPLEQAVADLLETQLTAIAAVEGVPSAVDLGERLREVLDLVTAREGGWSSGDIHQTYANFDGFDEWLKRDGARVRLVASNATRRSFTTVLDRLGSSDRDTLLIRYAGVPVSGAATLERLGAFKNRKNTFCPITAEEWHLLAAAGSVLASLREGNYADLRTDPPPTEAAFKEALRAHPRIAGLKCLAALQSFLSIVPAPLTAKIEPSSGTETPPDSTGKDSSSETATQTLVDPPHPLGDLGEHIRTILETHRWLEVRRLHRCLQTSGVRALLETVRSHLYAPPLSNLLTLHPPAGPADESKIQIVIWNDR